jgi:prophage tail gpP-like protein
MVIREVVRVDVGGREIMPLSVAVKRSLEEAAGSFELRVALKRAEARGWIDHCKAGPKVVIRASAGVIFTGHVERVNPSLASDRGELRISGRSKTGDAVDSAAEHKTREFKNAKPEDVAREIASGIDLDIISEAQTQPRAMFRLEPDDTIHAALDRWARRDGFALTDDAQGRLRLYDASQAKRHAESLIEGKNMLPASAVYDMTKRFSETKVRAQAPTGSGVENLEIETEAKDNQLARRRVKIIVPAEEMIKRDARERARTHRDRAAGKGTTAEVKVPGWSTQGEYWETGRVVYIESEWLGLAQDMLIQSVNFEQGGAGVSHVSLSLVDPRAHKGKKAAGGKSSEAYAISGEA